MTALSVVVPSYRGEQHLRRLLFSVAEQRVDPALAEIIVIDDGTPEFDATQWDGLTGDVPLTVIARPSNGGRAIARNDGIRAAKGDIVVFLDGDMTMEAGFLQAHADFHQQHPDSVAVGAIRWAPEVPDTPFMRYAGSRGVGRFAAGPVPFKCFVTGNSSVPRRALNELGGFDEGFSTYGGEDLELGYRLHLHGLQVHYLPQALSWHWGWKGLDGLRRSMATYGADSLPLLVDRHPELMPVLRLDFLQEPWWSTRRLGLRLAMWRLVQWPVMCMTHLGERLGAVPSLFFDYLIWVERTRSYMNVRNRAVDAGS